MGKLKINYLKYFFLRIHCTVSFSFFVEKWFANSNFQSVKTDKSAHNFGRWKSFNFTSKLEIYQTCFIKTYIVLLNFDQNNIFRNNNSLTLKRSPPLILYWWEQFWGTFLGIGMNETVAFVLEIFILHLLCRPPPSVQNQATIFFPIDPKIRRKSFTVAVFTSLKIILCIRNISFVFADYCRVRMSSFSCLRKAFLVFAVIQLVSVIAFKLFN